MGFTQNNAGSSIAESAPQRRKGERHHKARHMDAMVEAARQLHDEGWGYRRLARHFGIPLPTMRDWCNHRRRNDPSGTR